MNDLDHFNYILIERKKYHCHVVNNNLKVFFI